MRKILCAVLFLFSFEANAASSCANAYKVTDAAQKALSESVASQMAPIQKRIDAAVAQMQAAIKAGSNVTQAFTKYQAEVKSASDEAAKTINTNPNIVAAQKNYQMAVNDTLTCVESSQNSQPAK